MDVAWLLLIYTVPAEPSRKRAFIWRELKKIGAPYLRDGVCILPERPETLDLAGGIVAKVEEFGGEATLASGARLVPARSAALVDQHPVELEPRNTGTSLESPVSCSPTSHARRSTASLRMRSSRSWRQTSANFARWTAQVRARDYFGAGAAPDLRDLLDRCDRALGTFLEHAAAQDRAAP